MSKTIRIGLVGTGFGKRVMLPAFAACDGAELVAVCSGHRENAEAAAQEYNISGIYTDYETMLDQSDLDLALITTPPHLHWPMTEQALEQNLHVLCEKPTAMNADEANQMYEAAKGAGTVHLIDHELRFHPSLQKLKSLISEGFLGAANSVSFSIQWCYPIVLERKWNWWFDRDAGGGLLGALGSHQIDLLRWFFNTEFKRVNGMLHSFIKESPDVNTGELKPVTTDNFCSFSAELENGALGTVLLDATARTANEAMGWTLSFHGKDGSLIYDGANRLWGIKGEGKTEHTQPDRLNVPNIPEGVFPTGFKYFSREIIESLQAGKTVTGGATFYDGLKVQTVVDAIHRSHQKGGWVAL